MILWHFFFTGHRSHMLVNGLFRCVHLYTTTQGNVFAVFFFLDDTWKNEVGTNTHARTRTQKSLSDKHVDRQQRQYGSLILHGGSDSSTKSLSSVAACPVGGSANEQRLPQDHGLR